MKNHLRALRAKYLPAILIILFTICDSQTANSQILQPVPGYGFQWNRGRFTTLLGLPTDTLTVDGANQGYPWLAIKNGVFYSWNPDSLRWIGVSGTGSVTSVGTGYGLTGGPITNSGTITLDSATLAAYFLRRKDSTTDYATQFDISSKLNISDTANKWVSGIWRVPGKDSIFFRIGSTSYVIKDSTGGGGTWGSITGTLSSQTDLQTALDLKLNISDTASMLANYLRGSTEGYGIDIAGTQHKTWTVDTSQVATPFDILYKLNTSDSAAMLANYLRGSTEGWGINISGTQHKTWEVDSAQVATQFDISGFLSSVPTLQQVTDIGNSTDTLIIADEFNVTRSSTNYAQLAIGSFAGHLHGALNLRSPNGGGNVSSLYPALAYTGNRTHVLPDYSGTVAIHPTISGEAGKVLAVNATEDGLEWITAGGGSYTDADVEDYLETYTGDVTFTGIVSAIGASKVTNTMLAGSIANAKLANSTISGISLGSNLNDLTATNSTLTFSGAYNGGTARTIGINLSNANTWAADQSVPDEAYDATAWNGSVEVPTKNAIRDKVETLEAGFTELTQEFTSSATMSITLSNTPKAGKAEMYYLNGIVIQTGNISRTGTTVTLSGFTRELSDIITAKYSY